MAQAVCRLPDAADMARLAAIADDRSRPLEHTQRARIVLLSAERLSVQDVAPARVGVSRPPVWRWQRRETAAGVRRVRDRSGPAPQPAGGCAGRGGSAAWGSARQRLDEGRPGRGSRSAGPPVAF